MIRPTKRSSFFVALLTVGLAGCTDQRVVEHAERASDRQAEQNRQIAHQNHQLAEATNRLIAADAQARSEVIALQRGLQAEQAKIGDQRDTLESERRQLALTRFRDPIVAAVLTDLGLTLACLLPLVLCGYVLRGLNHEPGEHELAELLMNEFAADTPILLPCHDADKPSRAALRIAAQSAARGADVERRDDS